MKTVKLRLRAFLVLSLTLCGVVPLWAQPDREYKSLSEIRTPDDVYILRLHYKRLRHVPPVVFQCTNLRVLDLGKNFLDSIPAAIGTLANLEELDLRRNRLRTVPPEIGRLSKLRVLNLSRNPLLDLPDSFAELTQLEQLIVWMTGIVSFPPSFVSLNYSLKLIDMRACPMTYDDQENVEALLPSPQKKWDHVCNCK